MDLDQSLGENELFEAQAHIYKHILNYINSMVLGCALELGIPDIIHNHQKPITIQELVSKLNLPIEKTIHLQRVMRLLIHLNFFSITKFHDQEDDNEKEGYALTLSSKLLLKNINEMSKNLPSLLPFANLMIDHVYITTFQSLGRWFNASGKETNAFETAHGTSIWDYTNKNPTFNNLFNEAMASNSSMVKLIVKDYKEIFNGVDSLVDVGGGNGLIVKILLEEFPHLTCTVFDLPQVVANMVDTTNVKYIGGDMFSSIPSADALILKNILHDWNDENVLKILKRCKEAIMFGSNDEKNGKLIIIDMVIGDTHDHERHEITEAKLYFDMKMMALATGKERTKDEWEKLFLESNFNKYKISHISGLMSIIEVFP